MVPHDGSVPSDFKTVLAAPMARRATFGPEPIVNKSPRVVIVEANKFASLASVAENTG